MTRISFDIQYNNPLSHRTLIVRMISTAQTGFFYTTKRVRLNSPKLSAVKYDPVGARPVTSPRKSCLCVWMTVKARVLFVESRKTRK